MTATAESRVEFPEKLEFLLQTHQHAGLCSAGCGGVKVVYGGRGGLKSWGTVDAALLRGVQQFERVLCARETMDSIAESVHHLLATRIVALGLQDHYKILQCTITGPEWPGYGHTEFIFAGLRHNVHNIKSLEGVTLLLVEEAQNVSHDSWKTVMPTIRWEDKATGRKSEVWVAFNPKLATDATYERFVLNPPTGALVVKTDYRDNPWFPDVLRSQMLDAKERDPEEYAHVWLGECVSELKGAIFSEQLKQARADNRIGNVPYDRTRPVDTFWDLGYGDPAAVWFAQPCDGWYNLIDYEFDSGKTIADYVVMLNHKGYVYRAHWLPHDAVDTIIHKNLAGGDKTRSIEQLMRAACGSVPIRIAAKMTVVDRINAARTIFPQCRIDTEKCKDGIQALSHYQWAPTNVSAPETLRPTSRTELHNWASHGSSAFCVMAVSIKQPLAPVKAERQREEEYSWLG